MGKNTGTGEYLSHHFSGTYRCAGGATTIKIPGFSYYLHPYDENHILGFGQDTEETGTGGVVTKGMKLALFDVTDVEKPAQMHSLTIGEQGTYSPVNV